MPLGLKELNIDIIWANTPQAKGRVERANGTLQDRLVKEMRLEGVSDMQAGNAFYTNIWISITLNFLKSPLMTKTFTAQ